MSVRHGAGGQGGDLYLGRRQGHSHIQSQIIPVLGGHLQGGAVVGQLAVHPGHPHPAGGLLRLSVFRRGVGTVRPVDGHPVTPGDEPDHRVAGNGGAAFGKFHQAVAQSLHDDPRVGMLVGALQLADVHRGGRAGDDDALRRGAGGRRGLLRLQPSQAEQLVLDAGHALHRGGAAVADGGIQLVQCPETDLPQDAGQHILRRDGTQRDLGVLQL